MVDFESISSGETSVSVIGLGYVGLPVAVAFARKVSVVGFDIDIDKIETYKKGIDPMGEVCPDEMAQTSVKFTSDPADLANAAFHIVAVPTPVRTDNVPDLSYLEGASEILGAHLSKGAVVVYESTVFPGATEEVCVPILEQVSGLKCGVDFFVGYSPERINPGDKVRRLENIVKVVSGMDEPTLELIAKVYEMVIDAGIYRASSIKVAEAAKVIENSQRDLNIAFVNELSVLFKRMDIDTLEVLKAAGTKWNFLNFTPGLVGGHCIGVDPYYLTYRAGQLGYHPQVILAGRRINDDMGRFVAESAIKHLIKSGRNISLAKVAILGLTFKENCPDVRNTRVIDIVQEFGEYGIDPKICDPVADVGAAQKYYGIEFVNLNEINNMDCVVVAVKHDEFLDLDFSQILSPGGLVVDVKGLFEPKTITALEYGYWRL
ncbi:MAG: nucleotide sugar dehydrogenase [Defluviitaleaceae bacterium]|nr:nucleotide sugar dehydrogenase [Defluviitaleaceae bacterium]